MAVIKFTNSKGSLKKILDYIIQKEKTDEKLISGQACMPETTLSEMLAVKKGFGKEQGRQYIHIVQSFSPDEQITHEQAHDIAVKLAARFGDYQALIATHRDRGHVHSHKRRLNKALEVEGILITMIDERTILEREMRSSISEAYGEHIRIFGSVIPRSIKVKEASAAGRSIFNHQPDGKAAAAYANITEELLAV